MQAACRAYAACMQGACISSVNPALDTVPIQAVIERYSDITACKTISDMM